MAFAPILLFCKFRFAHPRGRRPSRCPARFPFSAFQSTHLLGGIPSDVRTWPRLQPFRFMSPVWERDQANTSEAPRRADFSPLALREERYAPEMRDRSCISNCAPAWGRLQSRLDKTAKSRLSPTHPCGGGPGGLSRPPILTAFQSTSPRRVRRCREFFDLAAAVIQTHTPERGATVAHQPTFSLSIYCNPRARAGCDLTRFVAVCPPEGGRPHFNLRAVTPHPSPLPPPASRRAKRARGRLPRALLKRSVPLISPSWRLRQPGRPLSSRCPRPFQSGRT